MTDDLTYQLAEALVIHGLRHEDGYLSCPLCGQRANWAEGQKIVFPHREDCLMHTALTYLAAHDPLMEATLSQGCYVRGPFEGHFYNAEATMADYEAFKAALDGLINTDPHWIDTLIGQFPDWSYVYAD